ncbi:MAG: pantoate kinase [Promethearchaeota archaeon]
MNTVRAFSPGHITGFFQICDEPEDPLKKGSRGAGVSVSKGVTTEVEIEPAKSSMIRIEINGDPSYHAPVSKSVIAWFLELRPEQSYQIKVNHKVELPIGAGFGMSGAGALSLALALNKAEQYNLSRLEVAQVAHIMEVQHRTGLGTVIAELIGGIEIRSAAGGPGVGQIETLPISEEYLVVCLPLGSIPTPKYLSDPNARKRINERGGLLTDALRANPTVGNFMDYSRHFAEYIGLISERVQSVLKEADEAGFTCSTAIFGENIFSIVLPDQVQQLADILKPHCDPEHEVLVMEIDCTGAKVLDA